LTYPSGRFAGSYLYEEANLDQPESPAVRGYLGLGSQGMVDWRFVEEAEAPAGPWSVCCRVKREEPRIEDVNLWRGILGPLNTKRVEPHKSKKEYRGPVSGQDPSKKDFTLIEVSRF
jgi:hypothetical protein